MDEETTIWQDLATIKKAKFDADRTRFMTEAQAADDGGWTKHTQWHWSRIVDGERLDYWPSRKKYQYRGEVKRGDVMKLINKRAALFAPGVEAKQLTRENVLKMLDWMSEPSTICASRKTTGLSAQHKEKPVYVARFH